MLGYSEFCKYFREDDCGKIKELLEEFGPFTVLSAVVSYSGKGRQISANMTRTIVQEIATAVVAYHAIWMLNEMINGDKDLVPDSHALELLKKLFYTQVEETEDPKFKATCRQLIEHIGTCPDRQFEQLLSYISVTNLALKFPDNVVLVMLERVKRYLKDDRAFFLVLMNSITLHMLEGVVAEVVASQAMTEMTVDQLQAQGYKVDRMPGAFAVSVPDASASSTNTPTAEATTGTAATGANSYNPCSGTKWAAKHPRRDYGRRRKR